MIEENELPEGWITVKLGDIAPASGTRNPQAKGKKEFLYIDIEAVDNTMQKIVAPKSLSTVNAPSRARMAIQAGDVIFSLVRPYLKNIAIVPLELDDQIASTAYCVMRPAMGIVSDFVFYTLIQESFISSIKTYSNSPPSAHDDEFLSMSIPLAPTAEQHRIVAAIEQQFTRLDAGVAALQRARAKLKRYRAAVLKAAVEGKLTENWRAEHPTTEPASLLLERILKERRARWEADLKAKGKDPAKVKYVEPSESDIENLTDLPRGWYLVSIGQVSECLDYKRVPINKVERAKRAGNIPYYGANGQVGWIDEYIFDEPLILVVEDETFIGREIPFCYKITGKTWVNNHAHVLRPTSAVNIDFLNYSLAYYPFTPLTQGTTGRRKLNQKALVLAPFPLPPLAEQEQIVAEVERRLSIVDALEATVAANLKRAERLRQSILREAFAGRLVPQDPTDEPAGVLLERIRSERNEHSKHNERNNQKNGVNHKSRFSQPSEPVSLDVTRTEQVALWSSNGN